MLLRVMGGTYAAVDDAALLYDVYFVLSFTFSSTEPRYASTGADSYPNRMDLEFSGEIWYWKGPAPHHFVTVPERECRQIESVSAVVSYGWGCIPVTVWTGHTKFTTSLFPKNGGFIVPLKAAVRRAEGLGEGDTVDLRLTIDV
jgi:hypothetical protein